MPTVADRVRELVGRSGLSQQEFATRIGLDNPKLSKSLSGVRRFSSLDLARIADLGTVTVDWLLTGEETELGVAARGVAGTTASAAVAEARRLANIRSDLAYLGYPQQFRLVAATDGGRGYVAQGERWAAFAQDRLLAARADVADPDLATVVERAFGVDVAVSELGIGFDGVAVRGPQVNLIVVGRSAVPWRQRFTIAHELGHLLLGDDQGVHLDEDVLNASHQKLPSERRANAFAAAFLMPQQRLREAVGSMGLDERGFAALTCDLRVSPNTLAYRLEGLRLVDAGRRDRFRRHSAMSAARLAGREADLAADVARAGAARPPGLLAHDAYQAYLAGATTLRLYAQVLGADPDVLADALENAEREQPLP